MFTQVWGYGNESNQVTSATINDTQIGKVKTGAFQENVTYSAMKQFTLYDLDEQVIANV